LFGNLPHLGSFNSATVGYGLGLDRETCILESHTGLYVYREFLLSNAV